MDDLKTGALVVGSQAACRDFLRGTRGYYVYIPRRPDGQPFYIGEGFGDRIFNHKNEARHPNDWRSNAYM
jgi:hypothetical protein